MTAEAEGDEPNRSQIEYWNARGEGAWVPRQERMDAMLAPMGAAMLEAADLENGNRVLDVGCGCGDTTLAAATRVGPEGRVTGVDVSGPMLRLARKRAEGLASSEAGKVVFVEADAQTADLASLRVDRVISRFGVMFFSDPVAAFTNVRTALVPGGRLAFVCWQTAQQNPWMGFAPRAVADILEFPAPEPGAPGPFAFGERDLVTGVLGDAGFADISLAPLEGTNDIMGGATVEGAVEQAIAVSSIESMIEGDAELGARVRDRLSGAFSDASRDGVLALPYSCWIVTARRG